MQTELTDEFRSALPSLVRVLQIIVGAMAAGCVMFLVIATQVGLGNGADAAGNHESTFLQFVALVFLAMAAIIRMIVPRVLVAASLRKISNQTWQPQQTSGSAGNHQQNLLEQHGDAARLWLVYMFKTIVGVAILEGATFFLIVVYMMGRSPLMVACAVGTIFIIAAHFPTVGRAAEWITDKLRRIDEQREMRA